MGGKIKMVIYYAHTIDKYLIGHWTVGRNSISEFQEVARFDNYIEARYELRYLNGGAE